MNYHEKLSPWTIIRLQPNLRHTIVTRFRRRGDAEGYLRALQRIMPQVQFTIVFDITHDEVESSLAVSSED
ncbi:MAG TPA: hypothetical protein DCY91_20235 [Cyanobacteria bacterium UBA11370]|nr:hypothetical protein [Cyanobacteria bacterium UBA11370]HBY75734.1 hypothetical protein [Cyanobacteria bacterium UBA11148]